ncbi:DUF2712 domain-containing protein [Bacillus velezensis]|uniref:DUF2712 domain-containing protein n=1 Tax=Bacillus velezensis TaxID=492670 RepID=UPI002DB5BBA5|nr:DUF2712 domain-containing protein [Bacillus velezensis]MEC3658856.1 DUF2712 domain-containing protein [Bacillus velezensis]MEC3684630.1 DUF2712 domain-containing protein [Bacillus velezensis]MEC3787581.1 DUF2712 domain-containing protein [Bacillus velezensis]MEC3846839.1 DUF2712 domain-containing protein [Bacillus velezensis]
MVNLFKKNFRLLIAGLLGLLLLTCNNFVKASNDNLSFALYVKPYHGNTYSSEEFRQTYHTDNPWKVNLQKSAEGAGTIMTFWLIQTRNSSLPKASDTHNVKQGSGNHYYHANSKGNHTNVALAVENNNYSSHYYSARGIWDEETW